MPGGATEGTESDALGYATSKDGIHWTKYPLNPIFVPDGSIPWEMAKVSAPFVWKRDGWYYMSYLGNDADMRGSNGLARSRDGITNWERHPSNPIIASSEGCWDHNCICKLMIIETETGYMAGTTAATGKLRKSELYIMKDLIWDLRQMESRRRMSGRLFLSLPHQYHTLIICLKTSIHHRQLHVKNKKRLIFGGITC